MQDEITQGAIAISVEASKMTPSPLQKAVNKVLAEMQKKHGQLHHGKQTIRQLMKPIWKMRSHFRL